MGLAVRSGPARFRVVTWRPAPFDSNSGRPCVVRMMDGVFMRRVAPTKGQGRCVGQRNARRGATPGQLARGSAGGSPRPRTGRTDGVLIECWTGCGRGVVPTRSDGSNEVAGYLGWLIWEKIELLVEREKRTLSY